MAATRSSPVPAPSGAMCAARPSAMRTSHWPRRRVATAARVSTRADGSDSMRVEWRHDEVPPSPAGASADAAALTESLREEISRGGPIAFARFMERALYDPAHGYYATAATRTTRTGDFL